VITVHRGSCLCESIQYEIESDLKAIVNCHCGFCSKAHGAAFTTLLFAPYSNLRIVAGENLIARYHMEQVNADRCFCSKCGTRLYNHAPVAGMISLVVATLKVGGPLRAVAHINTESKCSWHRITDDLPQFAATPPTAEFRRLLAG
jgi:hypothetical protein